MKQQEYSQHLVSCLKGYFDCPTFSDVTVQSKLKSFYAHRLVLASQSRYFAEALYKLDEAPSSHPDMDAEPEMTGGVPVLDLVEENSLVVEGILYFLYNTDYEDGSPTETPEIIAFNLLMSAAADKYGIPAMKACALGKLDAAARKFWDTYCFPKVIRHAYNRDNPAHDSDRAVLTLVAVEHAVDLMEKAEFVGILGGNDQFRNEFEDAMAKNGRIARDWPICMYCNRRHNPSECAHIWSG
ncbi:Uncharacterized protein LW94_6640 [Fusarium fujikuroi]|nr:Uncharacterized protein LW94_6640 [Fusarium fujikuroi]SCO47751.1 uncharacterized protein FFMR_08826 [Fusarium fujikuroi]